MKEIQKITVGVAGILLLGAINQSGAAVITSFTSGPLASSANGGSATYTVSDYGNASGATFSTPSSSVLTFTAPNEVGNTYDSVLSITPSPSGSYSMLADVTFSAVGDVGPLLGYWGYSTMPNGQGSITYLNPGADAGDNISVGGSSTSSTLFQVPAGDYFYFEMSGGGKEDSGKSPAEIDVTIIPESGNWQAGVFLVGVLGFAVVRRKKLAGISPKVS